MFLLLLMLIIFIILSVQIYKKGKSDKTQNILMIIIVGSIILLTIQNFYFIHIDLSDIYTIEINYTKGRSIDKKILNDSEINDLKETLSKIKLYLFSFQEMPYSRDEGVYTMTIETNLDKNHKIIRIYIPNDLNIKKQVQINSRYHNIKNEDIIDDLKYKINNIFIKEDLELN